ncbi:MAG TPA: ATP synthase F0 subunit B [Luteitalea sp.]|nr:ATP synthase F0 subunit B [Luteitalea sp.]
MPSRTMTGSTHFTVGAAAALALTLAMTAPAVAQDHTAPATTTQPQDHPSAQAPAHGAPAASTTVPQDAHDAAAPAQDHGAAADHGAAPAGAHAAAGAHGEAHGESIWVTLARLANFAILAGLLYWMGRKPLADHLAARHAQIRKDLVDAADMRQTATARLAEIEAKLAALPAELEALRTRGAEELEAERTRMRTAAEAERDRLVDQARREIASQTRNATAQLRAQAAALAVDVAESRLRATLTPAEQAALVDQYATQMRNVQ